MKSQCRIGHCGGVIVARGMCRKHYGRWHRHRDPLRERVSRNDRFWSKVDINEEDDCWEWMGSRSKSGYGRFGGKYAHRVSYAISSGNEPSLFVLHSCDNPPCVNPRHLREGTARENMIDMVQRGRNQDIRGEKNPASKLSDCDVNEIRSMRSSGIKISVIAKQYEISNSMVSMIANKKRRI